MADCKPVSIPVDPNFLLSLSRSETIDITDIPFHEVIDSLMFLTHLTRSDIAYVVNFLSRFSVCYSIEHWKALKRVLRLCYGFGKQTFDIRICTNYLEVCLLGFTETKCGCIEHY